MLQNQKQRCKQPVVAQLMTADQNSTSSRRSKREIIESLSQRKIKVIKTKSDNNHDRKTIAQKKLKSLNLISKDEQVIEQHFDEYQIGQPLTPHKKEQNQIQVQNRYNQCLRDDSSSSNYGEFVSHYRQSKSRYKNAKDKAKKLIQNMIHTSKSKEKNLADELNFKMRQMITHLPVEKTLTDEYCLTDRFVQKSSSTSGSASFKPKVQKCSTLRLVSKSPFGLRAGDAYRPLSNSRELKPTEINSNASSQSRLISKAKQPSILSPRPQPPKPPSQTSQKQVPTQRSIKTFITNSQSSSTANQNPLVLKGKHLFEEYGIPTYHKLPTHKEIIEETENACRQVSRQFPITRKQTQKLITRARQKNKKIIGKLKQMRERRSALRNSQSGKNDLSKSISRFSKLAGNLNRQSIRNSVIQSRLDQVRSSCQMQSSGENFLLLDSSIHSSSVIAFNQEIRQKILIHLQTIKTIADYAQSFTKIYQDCNEWEDLIFLLYKKYYMERFKIYHILKDGFAKLQDGTVYKESPFVFDFCAVSEQELEIFRQSKEEVSLELDLQTTNNEVKSALRDLYNKFIDKTSQNPSINMYQVDDCAQEILEDLNQEINMLIESCGKSKKIKIRINQAIQVGLMIAHLEGYVLEEIQEIVLEDIEKRQYFAKFYAKFLEIFDENGINESNQWR